MAIPSPVPTAPYHPHEDDLRLFTWPKRKHSHSTWFDQPFAPLFTHHHNNNNNNNTNQRLISSHGDKHTIAPLFDVRESPDAYFLEGEFPGVSRQDDIKVEWTGNRTILVEANVEKVDLEREWGVDLTPRTKSFAEEDEDHERERKGKEREATDKAGEKGTENKKKGGWKSPTKGKEESRQAKILGVGSTLRQWTGERHTGHYLRTFTFPHDVQRESLRARLGQGLLRMMVLKVEEPKENRQVDIEITECSAIY